MATRRPVVMVAGALTELPAGDYTAGAAPPAFVTLTYASSLTPDASAGALRICTATGDLTLFSPTNPVDAMTLRIRFVASGAQRTVTFDSAFRRPSHIPSTLAIGSGKRGDVALLYETGDSAWSILAAQAYA